MVDADDRHNSTLPVTAEVGSEGGSFAERTKQVACGAPKPLCQSETSTEFSFRVA
jgi:hypothetical protein